MNSASCRSTGLSLTLDPSITIRCRTIYGCLGAGIFSPNFSRQACAGRIRLATSEASFVIRKALFLLPLLAGTAGAQCFQFSGGGVTLQVSVLSIDSAIGP